MRVKRVATLLLFMAAILSLPLCLAPIVVWGGAFVPWMVVDFQVLNRSGEAVYITPLHVSPVSQTAIVPRRYALGQLPALRQADIRLAAGRSMRLSYDGEGRYPNRIAVRNKAGAYRQLVLDRGVRTFMSPAQEVVYTIGPFDTLADMDEEVSLAVQEAVPLSLDRKFWSWTLIGTFVGVIPIGLLGAWFRLARSQRRKEATEVATTKGAGSRE